MTASQANALDAAALAAHYAEDLVVGAVREVHQGVAGRVHGVGDRLAGGTTMTHRVHDGISKVVYTSVSAGLKGAALGLRAVGRTGVAPDLEESPRGRFVVAAVNGLIGDRLREEGSNLVFDLGIRLDGRDVDLDHAGVAAAYPRATGNLVVFIHGLSENEEYWHRAARPLGEEPERRSYGDRLAGEGWTPVYVRVNTGFPIAENGVALAGVLDRLVQAWPTDVRRIALVGHSMGGLIVRQACAVQVEGDPSWTDRVTDVICLGTPHLGAPLERVVNRGVAAVGRVPEVAAIARFLEYRSTGILDLRHGLARDVQNLPNARYRLVAATLTRSHRSVTAGTIGDYLVPYASALGRRRGGEEMFPGAETLHVPSADHFDLLNHDAVYAAVRAWLHDRSDPPTREESPQG